MIVHKSAGGFTLIEVLVFIIVSSLLLSTLLLGANNALRKSPTLHNQWIALETAKRCMEWFVDQRRINGFASLTCPSTPSPTACSAPTGFSVSTSIACTTWNSDSEYKTVTVSIAGLAPLSLTMQLGNY